MQTSNYNPFSIDNIIAYMEGTKPEDWATDVVRTGDKNCFFGHLFNFAGGLLWEMFEESWATTYMVYPVNDGQVTTYQQATAKERVVAYLKDLRDGKAKTTQALMAEEFEASCNEQISLDDERRARRRKIVEDAQARQAAMHAVATGKQHIISIEQNGTTP